MTALRFESQSGIYIPWHPEEFYEIFQYKYSNGTSRSYIRFQEEEFGIPPSVIPPAGIRLLKSLTVILGFSTPSYDEYGEEIFW
jgi:hypothetical protein